MTPNRVLLVAPDRSYRTASFVNAGKALGIQLTVASWGKAPLAFNAAGILLDPGSRAVSLSRIKDAAAGAPFTAVLATDDAVVPLAHQICLALGLPANEPSALQASTNKFRFREICKQRGVTTPRFKVIDCEDLSPTELASVEFPCVVKPLSLSASRGVIKCEELEDLLQAIPRVQKLVGQEDSQAEPQVLIESYIDGEEYSVEAVLCDQKLKVIAVFEKPDPLTGPFFEETIYLTPPRLSEKILHAIHCALSEVCSTLGFREGPVHAELRIANDNIHFIEVASRTIGGRCGRVIKHLTGVSLETLILSNAVRKPIQSNQEEGAFGVMMIPVPSAGVLRRVEGITAARKVPGVVSVEIDVREGQRLV
ncbi:MAG TPA: phosphoribosylglycinamide synthetase, partial [Gammaproteobacteria bacterium]|nr:phosphoribosylglycinamide synthetase [Gammaproteobacteria bacterium]